MTTQKKATRAEIVRERRSKRQRAKPKSAQKKQSIRKGIGVSSPVYTKGHTSHRMAKVSNRKTYDLSISLERTTVRAPGLTWPSLSSRWVSIGLFLIMVLLLFSMATANFFKVAAVDISGNQRISTQEIETKLSVVNQLAFEVVPSKIENDLLSVFPDLTNVKVAVGFPNQISITVSERTPVLAWYQDNNTTWIDSNGIAFTPRGDMPGIVRISANGNPPKPLVDTQKPTLNQPLISPEIVQLAVALSSQVPGGAPMIYDPKYGLGWQDPHGWSVYFGVNSEEAEIKKKVYQAIVDNLTKKGIQPTLISVAYLDAPFYK